MNQVTGETFAVTENLSCKSAGIIYLNTCAHPNCKMQYIGQSVTGHLSDTDICPTQTFVRQPV